PALGGDYYVILPFVSHDVPWAASGRGVSHCRGPSDVFDHRPERAGAATRISKPDAIRESLDQMVMSLDYPVADAYQKIDFVAAEGLSGQSQVGEFAVSGNL